MSDQRDRGIVMRLHPYSDTSWIVHWLTAQQGRIATLARGARRPKSALYGKLDLMVEAELSYVPARRSTLHTLREVVPEARHPAIREDYQKLLQSAHAVALLERSSESDTPVPELYELLAEWLRAIESHPAQPRWALAFEARLLDALGLDPVAAATATTTPAGSESVRVLGQLTHAPWTELAILQASGRAVRLVREFLRGRLVDALGSVPPTRAAALGQEG